MIKITPTQQTILKTAAARDNGDIYPLPKNVNGGAEQQVIASLKAKGLAGHGGKLEGDEDLPLLITDAGRTAVGLDSLNQEPADDAFEADVETAEQALGITPTANDPETPTETDTDTTPNQQKTPKEPRPGTKKAKMWAMLRRTEGATTKQIMDQTEWACHTVRGAIALAKRAGWKITTNKNRVVGPNQVGSPGSFTTYFLAANA